MIKEGIILKSLLSTLCFLIFSQSYTFSQDKSSILFNWKDWGKCSEQERDSLRSRWTDEKILKVVSALKTGTNLPDFVNKISDRISSQGYDLRGIRLEGANLQSANLQGANLEGAYLGYTNLEGANLSDANLQEDTLWYTNLRGAFLQTTKMQGAKLYHANLQRAYLFDTKLQGASLFEARFDTTDIWLTSLNEAQHIRDIVWGDSLHNRYLIYGEMKGDSEPIAKEREKAYRRAENTYRDLKSLYKKEGMGKVANEFNFRENEVETKRYHRYHYMWILRYFFLNLTYGYGSKPFRLFWYSLFIIVVFALIFLFQALIPNFKSGLYLAQRSGDTDKKLNWTKRKGWMFLDCLYFSALALCTFGYGALQLRKLIEYLKLKPLKITPNRWARLLVFLEAGLGIYLFALLAIVLFGRG
jgi:hypothetical protein